MAIGSLATAFAAGIGGCMVDCEDSYCDVVRAGGTAVQAWHFRCCLNPDDPTCVDLPDRIARFSLLAAEARLACEGNNWDRVRDIWREFRQLIPFQFASVVWEELCGREVAWGENAWSPFGPGTEFDFAVTLEEVTPPQVVLWTGDRPGSVEINRSYRIREGSKVTITTPNGLATAHLQGRLTLAESVNSIGDLEDWCRNHRPVELAWTIESDGWSGTIELDPGFAGNRVRFDTASMGAIGVAVRLSVGRNDLPEVSTDGLFEHAYLELPFHLNEHHELTIAPDGPIDGLQLLPLDPRLEWSLRSGGTGDGFDEEQDGCAAFARERAEAFLALHTNCDVRPTIGAASED
ncbi:MAG: hypothetical protein OSA40_04265 [Phycisphaerales bacterium]|nr:hypothetical protein [Phycisphaerales bacterium]